MSATTDAPALPGDALRESIVDELRRHIGEGLVEHLLKPQDDLWIRVSADRWADTGRALRAMGFDYFCFLSGLDWKPSPFGRGEDDPTQPPPERTTAIVQGYAGGETRFQVFARVTDTKRHVGVTIKADVPAEAEGVDNPSIDSWYAIYAGANWHERETHEMFGIGFNGHPDLRNIYLPTEFEGHPLRKDFPLLTRIVKPWPGIVDVEPMPAEEPGAGSAEPPAEEAMAAGAAAAPEAAERATGAAPATGAEPAVPTPSGAADTLRHESAAAAPETATDTSTVTSETEDDAPAHETPADDVAAAEAAGAPDTVVAEEVAADVAPVAEAASADVPAEPQGRAESVTGTAEEVEAVADAAARESRDVDAAVAEASVEADVVRTPAGESTAGEEVVGTPIDEVEAGARAAAAAESAAAATEQAAAADADVTAAQADAADDVSRSSEGDDSP